MQTQSGLCLLTVKQNWGCAVRWIAFALVLAWAAIPAWGAKRITVAQLDQILTADRATHKPGTEIAKQIGGIELSERLTEDELSRLRQPFASDSRATTALLLLADRSEFLDPPSANLPTDPAPDNAAQIAMFDAARKYVWQTLPRLPNFLATRVIDLYDDSPQAIKKGDWPTRAGLHLIGSSTGEISVRNERENQPATQGSAVWRANIGLISGGEFGNTLGMILTDATEGTTTWSHWETYRTTKVAVFKYQVPASASHYEVLSTLKREETIEGVATPEGGRGIRGIGTRPNVSASNVTILHTKPGYHGAIWVNPDDGTVLRITVDADLTKDAPFRRASILVEYGPVEIGGSTFICPIRSIALSMALTDSETITGSAPGVWLNETHFINYHRFGSSTRILTESTAPSADEKKPANTDTAEESTHPMGSPAPPAEPMSDGSAAQTLPPQPELEPAQPSPAAAPVSKNEIIESDETKAGAQIETSPASASSTTPEQPIVQPIIPATPTSPPPTATPLDVSPPTTALDSGPKLRIDTTEALVPVVVRDKQGHAVGNLGKGDFTVFDQGKPTTISGFTVIQSATARNLGRTVESAAPSVSSDAVTAPSAPHRFIVFLFDDRHVTASDFAIAQKAAIHMLNEPLAASDYAAVLSLTGANSGITQDRAALQTSIEKLSVHQGSQHGKEDCPDVEYYAADKIMHQHDPIEFQLTVLKAKRCSHIEIAHPSPSSNLYEGMDNPTDPYQRMAIAAATRAIAQGEQDAHQTLAEIEAVVRAMSKLPGQRILILLSPGFLSLAPDAIAFKSQILDQAADATVVINALDVRGLYVGNPDASQGQNVTISQITGDTSSDHLAGMEASENAMAELTNGTGGTFFHNNNDLLAGLKSLVAAPQYVYLLGISLKDVKANGTFHQIKVKVDKHDLNVQARHGYFAPRHTNSNK
jgi:VWFA-related protein